MRRSVVLQSHRKSWSLASGWARRKLNLARLEVSRAKHQRVRQRALVVRTVLVALPAVDVVCARARTVVAGPQLALALASVRWLLFLVP